MVSRNWTYRNEEKGLRTQDGEYLDCEDPREEAIRERCNQLADEWSRLMTRREYESWDEEAREREADYISEMIEEEGEEWYEDYKRRQDKRDAADQLRVEEVETLLASYGARMMRPYEHWNEEEHYMEWMETRYDSYEY